MFQQIFTILLLCIICLPVLAEYKKIPQDVQQTYQIEINNVIDREVIKSKKNIKLATKEIDSEKDIIIRRVLVEQTVPSILCDFYKTLIVTTGKYVDIEKDIPATDWYEELQKFMEPYFKDNNINTSKIDSLIKYANQHQNQIYKNQQ